jgi:hypothetical protein
MLRSFALSNIVFVKIGLQTLTSCKTYPQTEKTILPSKDSYL